MVEDLQQVPEQWWRACSPRMRTTSILGVHLRIRPLLAPGRSRLDGLAQWRVVHLMTGRSRPESVVL